MAITINRFDFNVAELFESPDVVVSDERRKQQFSPELKLLCIDDARIKRKYFPGPIVKGQIYYARELYEENGQLGVLLVGIIGPNNTKGLECGFLLSRFKLVGSINISE